MKGYFSFVARLRRAIFPLLARLRRAIFSFLARLRRAKKEKIFGAPAARNFCFVVCFFRARRPLAGRICLAQDACQAKINARAFGFKNVLRKHFRGSATIFQNPFLKF